MAVRMGGVTADPEAAKAAPPHWAAWLLCITVVGALVRLCRAGQVSLWADEGFAADMALRTWPDFYLQLLRGDTHPPLQYALLHLLGNLIRQPFWLRLPSVVAGTATIPLTGWTARTLLGPRRGLVAAALVALSGTSVCVTLDARSYALLGFFTMASWAALVRRPQASWDYAVSGILGLYTHYLMVFVLVGQAVWVVAVRPRWTWRRMACLQLLCVLGFVPWLPSLYAQVATGNGPQMPFSLTSSLVLLPLDWTVGATLWPLSPYHPVTWCLAGLAVAGVGWFLRLHSRAVSFTVLLGCVTPCLGLALAELLSGRHLVQARYFLFLQPLWAIGMAAGLTRPRRAGVGLALGFCVAANVLALQHFLFAPGWQKQDWRDAAAFVAASARPEDGCIVQTPFDVYVFRYYEPQAGFIYLLGEKDVPQGMDLVATRHRRIWLVSCQGYLVDPQRRVAQWLGEHGQLLALQVFDNVRAPDSNIVVAEFDLSSPKVPGH